MSITQKIPEWLTRLGRESGAFEIVTLERERSRPTSIEGVRWDLVAELALKPFGFPVLLYIEAKDRISPQIALDLLPRLKVASTGGIPLLCTTVISSRVAEMCKDADVCYLDQAGNCRLSAPGLFIFVCGKTTDLGPKISRLNPFSTKSSRLIRVLLERPDHSWQVQELAAHANVSIGLASKVKDALVSDAVLRELDRLLQLRNPKSLLGEWASHYEPQGEELSYYVMGKPKAIEEKLGEVCKERGYRYGLTEFSGAWRAAAMVRYERSAVYLAAGDRPVFLEEFEEGMRAKRVDSGSNLKVRLAPDDYIFHGSQEKDGINVVSPVQLYLDLMQLKGRGEEAAKEIYERYLEPGFSRGVETF
jgi:hypothetical protein